MSENGFIIPCFMEMPSENRAAILEDLRKRGVRLSVDSMGRMRYIDFDDCLQDYELAAIESCREGLTHQLRQELGLCGLCGGRLKGPEHSGKTCKDCIRTVGFEKYYALTSRHSAQATQNEKTHKGTNGGLYIVSGGLGLDSENADDDQAA